MNMSRVVKFILLAEAFAVATYGLGWWSVPLVAVAWALASADGNKARTAAFCAMGGWATLLLLDVARGAVGTMGMKLGGVMGIPPAVLWIATLLFPALLAWSAAALTPSLRRKNPPAQQ
jgi:hypothetical protein